MKKNEELHDNIIGILKSGESLTFKEIEVEMKKIVAIGEYDEKQLRNALYRLVAKQKIEKNEDKQYYLPEKEKTEPTYYNEYTTRIMRIFLEEKRKLLENPFEKFDKESYADALKVYDMNEKFIKMLQS